MNKNGLDWLYAFAYYKSNALDDWSRPHELLFGKAMSILFPKTYPDNELDDCDDEIKSVYYQFVDDVNSGKEPDLDLPV